VAVLAGLLGGVALFVGIMAWYFLRVDQPPPFTSPVGGPAAGTGNKENETLVLETPVLDIVPLAETHVKVTSGKADSVEVPEQSGLTAKLEGDTLTIRADKDAREGPRQLTVRGGKGKAATLQVNVKRAAPSAEARSDKP
jgi:hypothetical protein